MTIDIERLKHDLDYWNSVAPEEATHYIIDDDGKSRHVIQPGFYLDEGDTWWQCDGYSYWRKDTVNPLTSIPRPALLWDGEGLPPIGSECTIKDDGILRTIKKHGMRSVYRDLAKGILRRLTLK